MQQLPSAGKRPFGTKGWKICNCAKDGKMLSPVWYSFLRRLNIDDNILDRCLPLCPLHFTDVPLFYLLFLFSFYFRLSIDNITEEVKTLKSKIKQLEKAMKTGPKDVSAQFSDFIEVQFFCSFLCC